VTLDVIAAWDMDKPEVLMLRDHSEAPLVLCVCRCVLHEPIIYRYGDSVNRKVQYFCMSDSYAPAREHSITDWSIMLPDGYAS
jgi:hypothetical protein